MDAHDLVTARIDYLHGDALTRTWFEWKTGRAGESLKGTFGETGLEGAG
jgi:hypothetical protein